MQLDAPTRMRLESYDRPSDGRARAESYDARLTSLSTKSGDINFPTVPGHGEPEFDAIEVFRQNLKRFMASHAVGRYYEDFLLLLSVVSCFEYIYQTYLHKSVPGDRLLIYRLDILELVFASTFAFDWCLNCFLAEHRLIFLTSFFSVVDLLTVIPIFVTYETEMPNVNQITTMREAMLYMTYGMCTTRVLRALRIRRKLEKIEDAVQRFLGELVLSIIVMILFFASVMQFLEYTYQPHDYHTWMYYIWVTISTVGYGDITPISTQGRYAVMCIIGFAIVSIPKMTNELIEKMALQSVYMRNSYTPKGKNSKHIVICGDISSLSLNEFFEELFHEDHENVDLNAILLLPVPPATEMILLLNDPRYFLNLQYLQGSALVDHDLRRAKAQLAVAIFIMTDKFSDKPDEEDAKSILLNLSIKRYVTSFSLPPKLFCMQLIRPQNRKHLGQDEGRGGEERDLVVCLHEIKMGVLAKAVIYPGANTLLMNLICSFSDDEIPVSEEGHDAKPWVSEYTEGCGWEIYTTPLSPKFIGRNFSDLSYELYKRIGLILFGLQITDPLTGKARLLLNPADYVIPQAVETVLAFVIAENKQSSDLMFDETDRDKEHWLSSCLSLSKKAAPARAFDVARRMSRIHWFQASQTMSFFGHKDSSDAPPFGAPGDMLFNDATKDKAPPLSRQSPVEILAEAAVRQAQSQNEMLVQLKDTHFRTSYYLRTEPIPLKEASVRHSILDKLPGLKNHIIIVGKGITTLFDLIKPLRAKHVGVLRPIVILTADSLDPEVWSRVAIFDAVYVVRGSPLEERNLRRAGIFQAKRVIILADGEVGTTSEKASNMAALVDSDAIFAYQRVRKMNPNAQVVMEMINTSNIGYLYTPALDDEGEPPAPATDYKFSRQFAAGELFTTSLLDSIVCQGYYNPHIIKVIDKLISGVDVMTRNDIISSATESFRPSPRARARSRSDAGTGTPHGSPTPGRGARAKAIVSSIDLDSEDVANDHQPAHVQGSCLYQIALPDGMIGKRYGVLYRRLSKEGIIPLGLLRGTGAPTQIAPYVYTNPKYDTTLNAADRVFILSAKPIPDEADCCEDPTLSPDGGPRPVPGRLARKQSLFHPNFSASVSDGLSISHPTATAAGGAVTHHDLSALAAAQQQLREDLLALSSDVNSKFDALMTCMQAMRVHAFHPTSPPASPRAAPVSQALLATGARGPVRLAPLNHSTAALPSSTTKPAVRLYEPDEEEGPQRRADSIPNSDTTEVPAMRLIAASRSSSNGGITGAGVFAFTNRMRARSSSVGVEDGAELLGAPQSDVATPSAVGVKYKPGLSAKR